MSFNFHSIYAPTQSLTIEHRHTHTEAKMQTANGLELHNLSAVIRPQLIPYVIPGISGPSTEQSPGAGEILTGAPIMCYQI